MTSDAKILIEQAKSLPASDREEILEAILVRLRQDTKAEVDQAWRDLIDERLADLEKGSYETYDFDSVVSKLRGI